MNRWARYTEAITEHGRKYLGALVVIPDDPPDVPAGRYKAQSSGLVHLDRGPAWRVLFSPDPRIVLPCVIREACLTLLSDRECRELDAQHCPPRRIEVIRG